MTDLFLTLLAGLFGLAILFLVAVLLIALYAFFSWAGPEYLWGAVLGVAIFLIGRFVRHISKGW